MCESIIKDINIINNLNKDPSNCLDMLYELINHDTYYYKEFDKLNMTDEEYLNDLKNGLFKKVKHPIYEFYLNKCLFILIKDFDNVINKYDAFNLLYTSIYSEGFMTENIYIYCDNYLKLSLVKKIVKKMLKKDSKINKSKLSDYIYGYILVKISLYIIENRSVVSPPYYPDDMFERFRNNNLSMADEYLCFIFEDEGAKFYYKIYDKIYKKIKDFL